MMNLDDIILRETSQSYKDKCCMILLTQGTWGTQIQRDRKEQSDCQGLGEAEMSHNCLMGRVSVLQNKKNCGLSDNNLDTLNTTELYHLRRQLLCSFFF